MNKMLNKLLICVTVIFSLLFSIINLSAQDISLDDTEENPRLFALGITTLKEHGFGFTGRLRFNHIAVDGAFGSMPVYVMYQYPDGTSEFDIDMSVHADISGVLFFNSNQSRFQNGIRVGGMYDDIMGNGALFGWTGELTFKRFTVGFGLGLQYYPDFIEKINNHFPDTRRTDIDSSQKYQLYLGVNLMWYMF